MRTSDNPHGFIFGISVGRRNERAQPPPPNRAPTVNLTSSASSVKVTNCPAGQKPGANCPAPGAAAGVSLSAGAADPDGDTLLYTYSATGGTIEGTGGNVNWNLTGAAPGTYTVTVSVDDGRGCVTTQTKDITVENCECIAACVAVTASGPSSVNEGTPITYTARLDDPSASVTYNWSVSSGTIIEGQGTPNITVSTTNLGGRTVTATVEIGGVAPECPRTSSASTDVASIKPPERLAKKINDFEARAFNDDKAQLDDFAVRLQNEPDSTGIIVIHAGSKSRNRLEADIRANRSIEYLVNQRGISRDRLKAVVVETGQYEKLHLELWVVEAGATNMSDVPTGRDPRATGNRR
jgi:hypothetical protein